MPFADDLLVPAVGIFGLRSLADLPEMGDLAALTERSEVPEPIPPSEPA